MNKKRTTVKYAEYNGCYNDLETKQSQGKTTMSDCQQVTDSFNRCYVYNARKLFSTSAYVDEYTIGTYFYTYGTGSPYTLSNKKEQTLYACYVDNSLNWPGTDGQIGSPCIKDSDCVTNSCNTNYGYMICSALNNCTVQPFGFIEHDHTVNAFLLNTAEDCYAGNNVELRRCTNGVLSGSYPYADCNPLLKNCYKWENSDCVEYLNASCIYNSFVECRDDNIITLPSCWKIVNNVCVKYTADVCIDYATNETCQTHLISCTPDNSCQANTCSNSTCVNNCNQTLPGTKNCTTLPSCSDGIKNQDETGIDCGGSCPSCGCPSGTTKCSDNACRVSCAVNCTDSSWSGDTTSTCKTNNVTQTSNCGKTRMVAGTKDCSCTDSTWTPDLSLTCSDKNVTQTSNCNATRSIEGTKECKQDNTVYYVVGGLGGLSLLGLAFKYKWFKKILK